ncbi:MAG TPA: DUF2510 domain-containing protein [Acidimicrobiales bacterium]|nr:DUF2510 domain-containing protein [Acidimicrobiales bacterium]
MTYALVAAVVCGAIGYVIGNAKGRAPLGAVLGFLLGVIGVIIIAVIPKKKEGVFVGAPANPAAPGWFNDPHRRHELRYWNGISWTQYVSDNGIQGVDAWMPPPPPS